MTESTLRPVAYYKEGTGWVDQNGKQALGDILMGLLPDTPFDPLWTPGYTRRCLTGVQGARYTTTFGVSAALGCSEGIVISMDAGTAPFEYVRDLGERNGVTVVKVD